MKPKVNRKRNKNISNRSYLKILVIFFVASMLFLIIFVVLLLRENFVSPLPISIGDFNVTKIQKNKDGFTGIEDVLKKYKIDYLFVTSYENNSYLITLEQNSEAIVRNDNIESQISSLQKITKRLTMEGKKIKSLDLRYNKPVIVIY